MDLCTIVAKNYVSFARVLAHSYHEHHPASRCWVLVIDEHAGFITEEEEPFELVTIDDLDIPQFDRMAALYSVIELATAVKPWFLRHLMDDRGVDRLLFLDPDIKIYDSLAEVDRLLDDHSVVVTPHLTEAMPRDGEKPSETDILMAGSYNLGFLGLRREPSAEHLIEWWSERLERDCIVAPARGYFVDQRWLDFAPGLIADLHVLRDPGYNVAYWNVPTRSVARGGNRYEVNGRPLRFFHFSGYDPRARNLLSKHQTRVILGARPALQELCDDYARDLESNGFHETIHWEYSYDRLPNGLVLDSVLRDAYRDAESQAAVPASVWEPSGAAGFARLLNEPAELGAGAGVTRYLLKLRDARPDLKAAFPNLVGPDAERFVAWARTSDPAETGIQAGLMPNGGPPARNGTPRRLGMNVAGYFRSVLGVGEAARRVVTALEHHGVPLATVGLTARHSEQTEPFERPTGRPVHPVNLVCVNADVFENFAWDAGEDFFRDRHTIGLWWWEIEQFPERWLGAFRHVDEVWVGTQHIAEALAPVAPVPVVRIPIAVRVPDPAPASREQLGLPEGFLFLFSFDYESVFNRKNPLAVIEAFKRAFAPGSGAKLALKSINHEHHPDEHARLRAAAAEHPDVTLIERYVTREEKDAITAACDAYVSLHRAEGFGFTLAEAMALGKPVIATRYSGNLDYMTSENSFLVDCRLVPIGEGSDPYPPDARWADPDLDHATKLMREVFDDPQAAAQRAERGRRELLDSHSLDAAGAAMAVRLGRAVGNRNGHRVPGSAPIVEVEPISTRVRAGAEGERSPRGRMRRARQRLRDAALRLMRPYTVHQREVDEGLLRAISVLDEAVRMGARDRHELSRSLEDVGRQVSDLGRQLSDVSRHVSDVSDRSSELQREILDQARATNARADDLSNQVDELREKARRSSRFMAAFGFPTSGGEASRTASNGLPAAPEEPWTDAYVEAHREFVTRILDDPQTLTAFKTGEPLPSEYGVAFDERVVEFPWLFSRDVHGRVLDAGSTLNHPHTLARIRPRVSELHIVTLEPEPEAYPFLDVSYLYEDIRALPIRDDHYDTIVSLSTLEHVGLDNSQYGSAEPRAADVGSELERAMRELRRVLRPAGKLYLSVPYGEPQDFGWVRVFDAERLAVLVEAFGACDVVSTYFVYEPTGWQLADAEAAAGCQYRDHFSSNGDTADRAVAARAVACLELTARE